MAFVVRPYRRLPTQCPVTYERLYDEGHGTAWNVSLNGFLVSGTLPLAVGDICSLTLTLPTTKQVSVAAGIVRWIRGENFGIETLVIESEAKVRLRKYVREQMKEV